MRRLILLLFYSMVPAVVWAQRYDVSGQVFMTGSAEPIAQAVVELPGSGLWAVADGEGIFSIRGVPAGDTRIVVSSLGYVTTEIVLDIRGNTTGVMLYASQDNLKLESVVVTAKQQTNAMSTSRRIGGNAINHLQMVNISDITSLLPGGKTVNPNLLNDNFFSLRSGYGKSGNASAEGNAAFGTAVEVDGVRMSTNASLGDISGTSTRNIASTNIESVEVITGVPSAEYGDLTSGMVKITTRKGKTPYMLTLSTNPHTKQIAASKGFDLGDNRGVLNSNLEYTRATKNPTSPYTSYSRTGISLDYQNTFVRVLRFSFGVTANVGGMDTKDDPDAQMGEWEKARDNVLRAKTSLKWLLNRPWITSVDLNVSLNYADKLDSKHAYSSTATSSPAVHAPEEGYFVADMLPTVYFSTRYVDSKQLDYAANLKAAWVRDFGSLHSNAKVGVSWRADGNVGKGAYYADASLSPNGYRPRPYTDIPYMHNLAAYIEEVLTVPLGGMSLQLMAGLRGEKTFIQNTRYKHTATLSPRLNLKLRIKDYLTLRGGWGITEKLPSFHVLYPTPEYQDTRVFSSVYDNNQKNIYVYNTQPYQILYNDNLKWQRNSNSEVGLDLRLGGTEISLVGYVNRTKYPYKIYSQYNPYTYLTSTVPNTLPDGTSYSLPQNPVFKVDKQSGEVFVRDADDQSSGWVAMSSSERQTFMKNTYQGNSSPVKRMGLELVVDFPQINPIRTRVRLDGAYNYVKYVNQGETSYYPASTTLGTFYPYVGIYADTGDGSTTTYNGLKTHALDMNLTATTHLPAIRMVITLRLEASLLKRSQNLSQYKGREYAFNVSGNESPEATGGSIYDGNSYTAVWPVAYLDLDGNRHPFTDTQKNDPAFSSLLRLSNNTYAYNPDGYDPYFSANLSITKEIGDHVSVSFYANNFTNSRPFLKFYATGAQQVFTPNFYYGLTVRIKF